MKRTESVPLPAEAEMPFIPFTSDYGFKATFGNEADTRFLRKALQALVGSPNAIAQVEFVIPCTAQTCAYAPRRLCLRGT